MSRYTWQRKNGLPKCPFRKLRRPAVGHLIYYPQSKLAGSNHRHSCMLSVRIDPFISGESKSRRFYCYILFNWERSSSTVTYILKSLSGVLKTGNQYMNTKVNVTILTGEHDSDLHPLHLRRILFGSALHPRLLERILFGRDLHPLEHLRYMRSNFGHTFWHKKRYAWSTYAYKDAERLTRTGQK